MSLQLPAIDFRSFFGGQTLRPSIYFTISSWAPALQCRKQPILSWVHVDVSENSGFSFQIIHFNQVFQYKPSILGYHYFWKHPCDHEGSTLRLRSWKFPGD